MTHQDSIPDGWFRRTFSVDRVWVCWSIEDQALHAGGMQEEQGCRGFQWIWIGGPVKRSRKEEVLVHPVRELFTAQAGLLNPIPLRWLPDEIPAVCFCPCGAGTLSRRQQWAEGSAR